MSAVRKYARIKRRIELDIPGNQELPPFPEGLGHYLGWDLGPVRPWEWWDIDAEEWTEAQEVQAAWKQGIADAEAERKDHTG